MTLGHAGPCSRTYPEFVLDLPRSALLATWGNAFLAGRVTAAAAERAVTGGDEPHTVRSADGVPTASPAPAQDLRELLVELRAAGVPGLRLVLPVPGDVLGLPGPAAFNLLAVEAGECVLAGDRGLVPEVTGFGSEWERGAHVLWRVEGVEPRRVTDVGGLREAERELRGALRAATETLERLDVARWRPDDAAGVAAVRGGGVSERLLPPGTPPRCLSVLATAQRLRAVVGLAGRDDGAAVSGWEAQRRTEALRGLDAVSRRAVVAAVNAWLEPT